MFKNVTIAGKLNGAAGCAISIMLVQGSNPVFTHQYYAPFSTDQSLVAGTDYTLLISGTTPGTFTLDIQGCAAVDQPVPKTYDAGQNINDIFQFTA